jgi:hypothetical protein
MEKKVFYFKSAVITAGLVWVAVIEDIQLNCRILLPTNQNFKPIGTDSYPPTYALANKPHPHLVLKLLLRFFVQPNIWSARNLD